MAATILAGAAAAIVFVEDLPKAERPDGTAGKFAVHPHVEEVEPDDVALLGYIEEVYEQPRSLGTDYPGFNSFGLLADRDSLVKATREMATELARTMGKKRANRGILFGCKIELGDGTYSHGIIKVDLDKTQRFHFSEDATGGWSLDEVRDMLPPPKQNFAKYVIAPQPGGDSPAGVRDESKRSDSAADYLLEAASLSVPLKQGTKARVGNEALHAGTPFERVHEVLSRVAEDTPTSEVFEQNFQEVPQDRVEASKGSGTRPMPEVVADDPYVRIYETRHPKFKLEVGPEVVVEELGTRIIIQLPADAEEVQKRLR